MNRSLILASILALAAAVGWPAAAAGPDDAIPGQGPGQVRVEPQIPAGPQQRMDCVANPADPRCRSNPCSGPTQIYGSDEATCAPCLDNSIADHTNRRCVCVAGFVEVSRDQWGRAACQAAAPPQAAPPATESVSINAAEFYRAAEAEGLGHVIASVPFGNSCTVSIRQNAIRIEYYPPATSIIAPAPYEEVDRSCLVRLFGSQLQNGWEFVQVDPVDTSNCDYSVDYFIDIAERSASPADTLVEARLAAWGGPFCHAEIRTITLRGPSGEHWKRAFGH